MQNLKKAIQSSILLLERNKGSLNYMKLLKLLYISDRKSLNIYGKSVTEDTYCSMENGPVLSGVYDLIRRKLENRDQEYWNEHISEVKEYMVELSKDAEKDELSQREKTLLIETDIEFKNYDEWEMVRYCHKHLEEWKNPGKTSIPIEVIEILKALNKSSEEIETIEKELEYKDYVKQILDC